MPDRPDVAALLGSRICHDLISPLGAIGNGVELLMMGGSVEGPEMALISESVANANARIRFFRVAFGAASHDQHMTLPEIRSILADMTRGARLGIDWIAPGSPPRLDAKLAFLAIQCLESAMPWGGRITVARDGGAWSVEGEASRLKYDAKLWDILRGAAPQQDLPAAAVHFLLLSDETHRVGRPLGVEPVEGRITISF